MLRYGLNVVVFLDKKTKELKIKVKERSRYTLGAHATLAPASSDQVDEL